MAYILHFLFVPSLKLVDICSSINAISQATCGLLLLNHSSLVCPELINGRNPLSASDVAGVATGPCR